MPHSLQSVTDPSFLAQPGEVADWRAVVLLETATETGVLAALPGTHAEVAARAGTDPGATRIMLDALEVYDVTRCGAGGTYVLGPGAPGGGRAAVLHQHAGVITRWADQLRARVAGEATLSRVPREPDDVRRWLESLGTMARERAPGLVDACLAAVPDARTVLDLGGGHGEYAREFARRRLDATMQDRPLIVDLAHAHGGLADEGVVLVGADFFEQIAPGPFDIVWLAGVAHTYPEKDIRRLYEHVRPVTGRALVISTFLRHADDRTRLFAVQMLSLGNGADTHSREEHTTWLHAAGFTDVTRHPAPGGHDLLVATT